MIKFDLAPIQEDLNKAEKWANIKCFSCGEFGHMMHKCPIDPRKMYRSKEYWLRKREKDAQKRRMRNVPPITPRGSWPSN